MLFKTRPELAKSETIRAIPLACSNELAAVEFLEKHRWGGTPCCVHCGSVGVYKMRDAKTGQRNKRFLWRCRDCHKQFTVRIGTVYEESRIELRHWCYAFWRAATSKKGVAALEIMRQTGLSYKSSLFLLHRIRFAMGPTTPGPKLTGTVECDETYIGGKRRHRVPSTPENKGKFPKTKNKPAVFAAVQRGGDVRVRPIPDVSGATLRAAVNELVDKSARLITDELSQYQSIGAEYAQHDAIKHGSLQYVDGDITTNTAEGFFATLKRGVTGIYHSISRQHLPKYLNEFEFRYNARKMNDGDRTVLAIRAAEGKRLMYREPKAKPAPGEQLPTFPLQ